MLEVLLRSQGQNRFRSITPSLGERIGVALDVEEGVHLLAGNFLFVQRAQDQHRGARILEGLDLVQVIAERPRPDHQRVGQAHSEICGAEVHYFSLASGSTFCSSVASNAGTLIPASCEYTE